MKRINKRDFDYVGILIGVIIGLILGYIVGSELNLGTSKEEDDINVSLTDEFNYIYTLQIGKFGDAQEAIKFYDAAVNKGIECVYVSDNNNYYIYASLSTSLEEINSKKEAFSLIGYEGIVKKEFLYNRANNVIEEEEEYLFYTEMIDNLINSLNGETIVIQDEFLISPIDLELVTWVNMLSSIQNSEYKNKIQLQTFKMIVEKLG